jgi:hypothetical protein
MTISKRDRHRRNSLLSGGLRRYDDDMTMKEEKKEIRVLFDGPLSRTRLCVPSENIVIASFELQLAFYHQHSQ